MVSLDTVEGITKYCNGGYCTIVEFFSHKKQKTFGCNGACLRRDYFSCPNIAKLFDDKVDDRALLQTKCVESFKYVESGQERHDIGWRNAWALWVKSPYAERFAELYDKLGIRDPEVLFEECMKPGSRLKPVNERPLQLAAAVA